MVRVSYLDINSYYQDVKQAACGRQACSVMILVAYEVDAMASTKMLTQLLRSDHIGYTIRPVRNQEEINYSFRHFLTTDIRSVFLINCGAQFNIPKVMQQEAVPEKVRCYILDNHRPLHLGNIYSAERVVIFDDAYAPGSSNDDESLPSIGTDLSGGNSSSSSSEESDGADDEEDFMEDEFNDEDPTAAIEEHEQEEDNAQSEKSDAEEEDNDGDMPSDADVDAVSGDEDDGDHESQAGSIDESVVEEEGEDDDEVVNIRRRRVQRVDDLDETMVEGWDADEHIDDPAAAELGDGDEVDEEEDNDEEPRRKTRTFDDLAARRDAKHGNAAAADDDEEDDDALQIIGKKRKSAAAIMHQAAKQRRRLLNKYYSRNANYATPTALMLLELLGGKFGHKLLPTEVVWQAVLGVTYQYFMGNLSSDSYQQCCEFLRGEFGDSLRNGAIDNHYSVRAIENDVVGQSGSGNMILEGTNNDDADALIDVPVAETGHVEEGAEYRFFLFRHWSLFDAMYHSPYIAAKIGAWNSKGRNKLQELLARIGVPLLQCRQAYQYMPPSLRHHFQVQLADRSIQEAYNLTNPGITYRSFFRYNAFKNPIAAADIVCAASALIEAFGADSYTQETNDAVRIDELAAVTPETEYRSTQQTDNAVGLNKITGIEAFYEAYHCLGMQSTDVLSKGVQYALDLQKTIVKKASAMLDGSASIHKVHRLYYAYLSSASSTRAIDPSAMGGGANGVTGSIVEQAFGRPMVVARLGQFIMDIKRNLPRKAGGWTGSALLPLVLLSQKQDSKYLVVGISPLDELSGSETSITDEQKQRLMPLTNFRQYFKLAAQLLGAEIRSVSFASNVVEVKKEDVEDFLGALDDCLRKATPRHLSGK